MAETSAAAPDQSAPQGPLTVESIIKMAGGARAITEAGNGAFKLFAVYKWKDNGIPQKHIGVVAKLAGLSVEDIFRANMALQEAK